MQSPPLPSKHAAHIAIAHLFFLLGLLWGSFAARIPGVTDLYALDKASFSLILLAESIAALLSAPLVGMLIEAKGSRRVFIGAIWIYMPLYMLIGFMPNALAVTALVASMGFFAVCYDVALNTQASEIEAYVGKRIIGSLHGFFSLGGLAGALIATLAVKLHWPVTQHLLGIGLFGLITGLWAAAHVLPSSPRPANVQKPKIQFRLPERAFWGLALAALASSILEGGMGHWSALYMRDITLSTEAQASFAYGLFSMCMLIGRFNLDRVSAKFSSPSIVFWGAILSFTGLSISVFWPTPMIAMFGYAIVGLGIAGVFPSIFRTAGRQGAQAVAAVSMMGALGNLVGPPLIGSLATWQSLRWGLFFMALAALVIAPCAKATAKGDQT